MIYFPFIYEKKKEKKPYQIPLYKELEEPIYREKKEEKEKETVVIIEL